MVRAMDPSVALSLAGPALAVSEEARAELAFDTLYSQHFRGVWRTLRRLGVAEPHLDDAAQDVFVIVHRKLPNFDGRAPRSWLYAIAIRVASDYRRGAAGRRTIPLSSKIEDGAPGPARLSELQDRVRLLHALLDQLDMKKRTVFVLSELEQLTVPEISEALGANVNTVYARLRAARAEFEAALRRHRRREQRKARVR